MKTIISDFEIECIRKDLHLKGIKMSGLEVDLLDHLLCATEKYIESGHPFKIAYEKALFDLCKDQNIDEIQRETSVALNKDKGLIKHLSGYGLVAILFVTTYKFFPGALSTPFILTGISLVIFFLYHAVFSIRKQKSIKSNQRLFSIITFVPLLPVILFLIQEFQFRLIGTSGWVILLIAFTIPLYYQSTKRFLHGANTWSAFLSNSFRFVAMADLIWIPLIFCLKFIRPDMHIASLVEQFLMLSVGSALFSLVFQKLSFHIPYLRKTF